MTTEPSDVVLSLRDVSIHFGGVTALDEVSFDVRAGRILGLIGPNGAGKTTFIDAVTGLVGARAPTAFLKERKAVSGSFTKEGHG